MDAGQSGRGEESGSIMSFATDTAKKREADERALAAAMAECDKMLAEMHMAQPAAAERIRTRLEDALKNNPKLPMEFKRKTLAAARASECMAYQRAADTALRQAQSMARADDLQERNRLVGEARAFGAKAASFGADEHFRATLSRKIEIIMLTGHVEHHGNPTVAKPLDTAPKNPHHAKD